MKTSLIQDKQVPENEIHIHCVEIDSKVIQIKEYVEAMDYKIIGKSGEAAFRVMPEEIYYIESIDKKTFLYLKDNVVETQLRLYQLEEKLNSCDFFRASKSTLINMKHIEKAKPMLNRNLLITFSNGEQSVISRRNIKEFNIILGME